MEMPTSPARAVRRAKSSALPSSGLQRHVPARLAADGPGAARVGAPRGRRVVAALAVRQPDRVDGRQVEHVEAQLGELRQQLLDPGEAAPRAREELVPGPERGALGIHEDLEGLVGGRLLGAIAGGRRQALLDRERFDAEQGRALRELAREVALTGRDLALQLVLPGGHAVDPRDHAELPAPERVGLEGPVPAIEVLGQPPHGQLAPASLARARGSAALRRAPRARRAGTSPTRRRARRWCAWPGSDRRRSEARCARSGCAEVVARAASAGPPA